MVQDPFKKLGHSADPLISHLRVMPLDDCYYFFYELGKQYGMFYVSCFILKPPSDKNI